MPSPTTVGTRRLTLRTAAAIVLGLAAFPGSALASSPESSAATTKASAGTTLLLHTVGRPKGGDGHNVVSEAWSTFGAAPVLHIRDAHPDDPRLDTEEWNTPSMWARVHGPLDLPLAKRIKAKTKVGCIEPQNAYLEGTQDAFTKAQRSNALQIDALRRSAKRRAKLPAGPVVDGHETVEQVIRPGVGAMTPILFAAFDAETGQVRRLHETQSLPTGLVKGLAYMDFTEWELTKASAAEVHKTTGVPATLARRCD